MARGSHIAWARHHFPARQMLLPGGQGDGSAARDGAVSPQLVAYQAGKNDGSLGSGKTAPTAEAEGPMRPSIRSLSLVKPTAHVGRKSTRGDAGFGLIDTKALVPGRAVPMGVVPSIYTPGCPGLMSMPLAQHSNLAQRSTTSVLCNNIVLTCSCELD